MANNLHLKIFEMLENCPDDKAKEEAIKKGYLKTDEEFLKKVICKGNSEFICNFYCQLS